MRPGDVLAFQSSPGGDPGVCVRALQSTLHPELADAFEAANRTALRRHGVDGAIPRGSPLRGRAATWLIVAARPGQDTACMAGIRLELRDHGQSLPLERVMAGFGEAQLALLHRRFIGSIGEFAGLWVKDEFRKLGLPALLISAGIAAARLAGLSRLITLLPAHTCPLFAAEGFRVILEMGDDGAFQYPNEHYRSWVMELDLASRAPVQVGILGGEPSAR